MPGVAIAIVKDGEVVLAEGFGLRDVAGKLPVTSKTLFAIGSCTKAFTTFVMGTLVDEGKLEWDKPLRNAMLRRFSSTTAPRRSFFRRRFGHSSIRSAAARPGLVQRHAFPEGDRSPASLSCAQAKRSAANFNITISCS